MENEMELSAFNHACEVKDYEWLTDYVDSSDVYHWIECKVITLSQFRIWLAAVESEATMG